LNLIVFVNISQAISEMYCGVVRGVWCGLV